MRFKNLKISVAVALILFVLVLGNIFALAVIQNNANVQKDNQQAVIVNDKTNNVAQQATTSTTTTQSNNQATNQAQNDVVAVTPIIIHQTIRTRAS